MDVLTFFWKLDKGLPLYTVATYLAAISTWHVAYFLAMCFLPGVHRLRLANNPSCDLDLVMKALHGPAFEPIEYVTMKFLSEKTALLLNFRTFVKQADDHCVLSVYLI